jgi:hypothetical protein
MRSCTLSRSFPACAVAALLLAPGCGSSPDATDTVDSMGKLGVETAKVNDGIDATLGALNALVETQGEDLKTPFEAYSSQVAALEEQSKVVGAQAREMEERGNEFFTAWEAEAQASEGGVSPERRAQLSQAYAKIKEDAIQARDAFQPFLASLKDVQGYLKLDLSRKGVESVKDLAKKAKADGDKVKASIESMLQQVNSVRGMLATSPS